MIDLVIAQLAGKGWCVLPGFLPDELVRKLAQEAEALQQSGLMHPAATGQGGQALLGIEPRNCKVFSRGCTVTRPF